MEFWIVIFLFTFFLSIFLALRSMRNTNAKKPQPKLGHVLFLIRNSHLLTPQVLEKLYDLGVTQNFSFSLERLFKGEESALVIFGPKSLEQDLTELDLLELEDYLLPKDQPTISNKVTTNHSFGWRLILAENAKIEPGFLADLGLLDQEQFLWQVVSSPLIDKKDPDLKQFKVVIRAMVVEKDPNKKVKLAKRIFNHLSDKLELEKNNLATHPSFFEDFRLRLEESLSKNTLSADQLINLIKG